MITVNLTECCFKPRYLRTNICITSSDECSTETDEISVQKLRFKRFGTDYGSSASNRLGENAVRFQKQVHERLNTALIQRQTSLLSAPRFKDRYGEVLPKCQYLIVPYIKTHSVWSAV